MNGLLRVTAALVLFGLLSAGCGARQQNHPVQAPAAAQPEPAPVAPKPEPAPANPTPSPPADTPKPSPVSSGISVVKYPWIKAPAEVSLFTGDLVIRFSGPVVRESVEKRLITEQNGAKVAWLSDTEATITVPGCSFSQLSAAGARDAEGRELTTDLNPMLKLRYPCHGGGYTFLRLGQQKPVDGWPSEAPVLDIDTERGIGIGSLGGMLFRYAFDTGKVEPLVKVNRPAMARFATDGAVLMAEPGMVRLVNLTGKVLREFAVLGSPGAMAVSPVGTEAMVFMRTSEGLGMTYVFDLTTGTTRNLGQTHMQGDLLVAAWRSGTREVAFMDQGKTLAVLHVDTGERVLPELPGEATSPDGKWVARQKPAGLYAAGTADPVVALAEGRPTDDTMPVWSPDSRYVLMTTGELVDLSARKVVADYYWSGCGPVFPDRIWTMGEAVYLTFSRNCH